ncbi:hypothetical protein MWH06_04805 [Wolbachia pipientis]|nr:hypothetical protein MWH06_04805 [Wolbachia pipientis]
MLDSNENQNSSPKVTLPTDTTSDQVEAINKNSIESETEQSLQSSLAGIQDSLAGYVDAREDSPDNTEKLLGNCHLTSSSTPSDPISTGINGTTQIANDGDLRASSLNEVTLGNEDVAAQLQAKEDKIKELEAKINQLNAEIANLKEQLQTQLNQANAGKTELEAKLTEAERRNKELEAKNKTTEQPKQSNGARYTATVGMGLAAGLIAFTALERTVRLEMLVMIGIAVTSALVVGGITYAVLPSTQVDGVKAQEVNENGKSK